MSAGAARAVAYLPIDGLIVSLEAALAEIAEIESRGGPPRFASREVAGESQFELLRACKASVLIALRKARSYAKGPNA